MSSAAYVILKDHDVFGKLSKENVEKLAYGAVLTRYEKGANIYTLGQEMQYVYVLNKGIVKLSSNEFDNKFVIKDIIYKDQFFGENIFTSNTSRTENAITIRECSVIKIKLEHFRDVVTSDMNFANYLLKSMSITTFKVKKRMNLYTHADSRSRIIHFFNEFTENLGVEAPPDGTLLDHGLSHNEIGLLTDTSRQTVSKVMGELKTKGIIHFEERHPDKLWVKAKIE